MIVSSDIDPSPNLLHCLVLIPQTGAGGLKLVLAVNFTSAVFLFVKKTFIHCSAVSVVSVCLIFCLLFCVMFVSLKPLKWLLCFPAKYLLTCNLLWCFLFAKYKNDALTFATLCLLGKYKTFHYSNNIFFGCIFEL